MIISEAVQACYDPALQPQRLTSVSWVFAGNAEDGSFIAQCLAEGYSHAHIKSAVQAIREHRLPLPASVDDIMMRVVTRKEAV